MCFASSCELPRRKQRRTTTRRRDLVFLPWYYYYFLTSVPCRSPAATTSESVVTMGDVFSVLLGRRGRRGGPQRMPSTRRSHEVTHGGGGGGEHRRRAMLSKKYSYIPDTYTSLEQVTAALREQGLESSNLILGIDFTKSNEWTGKRSFNGQCLHKLSSAGEANPYEAAIGIIGRTLAPFDEDNLIPCFGFGDATTHDYNVFSFHADNSPCHGFEEVLACYRKIVPHLLLSGPTSFAPIVEAAVDIVDRSGGQYHVLVIVADGQVTRSVDTTEGDLSPQERRTVDAIVMASSYPLSIVLVGVGDGPWEDMQKFDDKLPARAFDNFQVKIDTSSPPLEIDTSSPPLEAALLRISSSSHAKTALYPNKLDIPCSFGFQDSLASDPQNFLIQCSSPQINLGCAAKIQSLDKFYVEIVSV